MQKNNDDLCQLKTENMSGIQFSNPFIKLFCGMNSATSVVRQQV